MTAVSICSDFGAPQNKVSHYFHCFPIYLPWSDGTGHHDLSFLNLSFKPAFSLSSFTFIKRLFTSLSVIMVVSSAYLRLLIFLLAILIPACASSSREFRMMYLAYKFSHNISYCFSQHSISFSHNKTLFNSIKFIIFSFMHYLYCVISKNCFLTAVDTYFLLFYFMFYIFQVVLIH